MQHERIYDTIEDLMLFFSYFVAIWAAILNLTSKETFYHENMYFIGFPTHENIYFDTNITFLSSILKELC